jgi:hypothetical protein
MYSFVHNKVRNRLKHNKADDLVYIHANTRLIRHRRGPRIAQWYGLNQVHLDDDSDGEDPDGEDIDLFYKMTLMMAMVAMELLMMLGMVMTVMVISIANMTMATMEAVILQSMTSMRKPQREAMHTLLELLPSELM